MTGVGVGCFLCGLAIVKVFFRAAPGNSMIFHAGKFSDSACDWAEMFEREIKTNVTIKFAIYRVARVTFVCAPNLPTRIAIARKGSRTCRRENRRVNGV